MAVRRPNMSSSLDSPYEAELRRGVAGRIFGQHLENEYVASRLLENRPLIRVTCVLSVLLSLSCAVRHFLVNYLSHDYLPQIAVVFLASVALASKFQVIRISPENSASMSGTIRAPQKRQASSANTLAWPRPSASACVSGCASSI